MSQTTLTAFFNSRKRPAAEDLGNFKNKIAHIERPHDSPIQSSRKTPVLKTNDVINNNVKQKNAYLKTLKIGKTEEKVFQSPASPVIPSTSKGAEAFAKKVNANNINKVSVPSKSTSVISARKELSLGDIKQKLAGSSRLAELRATADRLSKGIQQLKENSEKRNLKDFKSIDVDVPIRFASYFCY